MGLLVFSEAIAAVLVDDGLVDLSKIARWLGVVWEFCEA